MIHPQRISLLNDKPIRKRDYVLYWMQASQRAEYNHALEFAIEKANELNNPLVAFFGITDNYPEANERHYYFLCEGLKTVHRALAKRGVQLVIRHCSPENGLIAIARKASCVVVDAGYTKVQRAWRSTAAAGLACALFQVETDVVVPVTVTSPKEEYAAATIRKKIQRQLKTFLIPLKSRKLNSDSLSINVNSLFSVDDPAGAVARLNIDRSVSRSRHLSGGTLSAKKMLTHFIKNKLDRFADLRNDPGKDYLSNLSPYLHFGHIAPLYIALQVQKANSPGNDAFLEELIIRRELSMNFVWYNKHYDSFACLPKWAQDTLRYHKRDRREHLYTRKQFEQAKTHDPYWNAAQLEMVLTGKMHGYMRMYWGKKILEWSKTPEEAFQIALYLNNKYELDGRDPNAYTGVAWCFGKHDRAWAERPIFGKVRYMNAAGLKRKFEIDAYVNRIESLHRTNSGSNT